MRRDIVTGVVAERIDEYWDAPDLWQLDPVTWGKDYVDDELRHVIYADSDEMTEDEYDSYQVKVALLAYSMGVECNLEMQKRLAIYEQRTDALKLELTSQYCKFNPAWGGWNLSQDKRGYWRATRRFRGGKLVSRYIGKDLSKAKEVLQ